MGCNCDDCRELSLLTGNQGNPGADGQDGTFGANSDLYLFNTANAGNPTNSKLLFNNANLSAATSISVSNIDGYTNTVTTWLAALNTSDATLKGFIRVNKEFDSTAFAMYSVSAATANAGYYTYTVSYLGGSGNSPFASNDRLIFSYVISGNNGAAGTQGIVLIPLTYPQTSASVAGTDNFTFNIPANTLVNNGDIVEFQAEVEVELATAPNDNGTGGVTYDNQTITITNNGINVLYTTNAPFLPDLPTVKVIMTVTKTGATAAVETHEIVTPSASYPKVGIYTNTNSAANFAAPIPLLVSVSNLLGAGSTAVAPFATIKRATMKYYAA